jgi:hypothetical protein
VGAEWIAPSHSYVRWLISEFKIPIQSVPKFGESMLGMRLPTESFAFNIIILIAIIIVLNYFFKVIEWVYLSILLLSLFSCFKHGTISRALPSIGQNQYFVIISSAGGSGLIGIQNECKNALVKSCCRRIRQHQPF